MGEPGKGRGGTGMFAINTGLSVGNEKIYETASRWKLRHNDRVVVQAELNERLRFVHHQKIQMVRLFQQELL